MAPPKHKQFAGPSTFGKGWRMSHPHTVVAPVLSDGVVTLRPHQDSDEAAAVEQCQDPESVRWTSAPQPYGPEQARAFISAAARGWAQGGNRVWAVEVLDPLTGRPRFGGSLDYRPDGAGAAELGFGLHPAARGRGLMARAARLAITYAFDRDGIEVMHWRAYVGNWASRRTAWRCGFRVEGTVRQLLSANGRRYDAWVGSLAKGEPMEPVHRWLDVPVLEGERVRLRPWREDDARATATAPAPDEPGGFPGGQLPTPEGFDDWLTAQRSSGAEGEAVGWCVADRNTDRPLGHVQVFGLRLPGRDGDAELSYWLHTGARGRGVMQEALELLLSHAFAGRADGGLGLRRLHARVLFSNAAAQAVLERAGFTGIGTEHAVIAMDGGAFADDVLYELLAPADRPAPLLVPVVLEGAGVRLRPWRRADEDRVVQACTDPVTGHWLSDLPAPYTRHEARRWLRRQAEDLREGSNLSWCVADPATDEALGAVSLMHLLEDDGTGAEVGYWAHPAARGRGVLSEAVRLAVRHAFVPADEGGLGRRRLRLNVADGNVASQRVALRGGFVEVGRDRLAERLGDGSYVDLVRYDLLQSEYVAR
jgi:RimJ/RimL family protein N-acetyltransferase